MYVHLRYNWLKYIKYKVFNNKEKREKKKEENASNNLGIGCTTVFKSVRYPYDWQKKKPK